MPAPRVNRPAKLLLTARITSVLDISLGGQSSSLRALNSSCMPSRMMVTTLADVVMRLLIRKVSRLLARPCRPPSKKASKAALNLL
ncbi:hypothetical protein D3C79_1013610 [compost metagenome]